MKIRHACVIMHNLTINAYVFVGVMDRRWMYGPRPSIEYLNGVNEFIKVAKEQANKEMDAYDSFLIYCPCKYCKNEKKFRSDEIVFQHLILRGFVENYTCWNKHREEGFNEGGVEDGFPTEEYDVDHILGLSEDELMYHVENVDEMIHNVERHDNAYNDGELARYKKLIEDSKKPFYPGCDVRHTRLNIIIKLL